MPGCPGSAVPEPDRLPAQSAGNWFLPIDQWSGRLYTVGIVESDTKPKCMPRY